MKSRPLSYEQLRQQRSLLLMLVLALVVILVGIFVELMKSQRTSQVEARLQRLAQPLDPTFQDDVFDKLDRYTYISPENVREQIHTLPIRILDKESETVRTLDQLVSGIFPGETASDSAQINGEIVEGTTPSESASGSGELSPTPSPAAESSAEPNTTETASP